MLKPRSLGSRWRLDSVRNLNAQKGEMDLGLGWWELPEHENYQAWLAAVGHKDFEKFMGGSQWMHILMERRPFLQKASPHFGDMNRYMMLVIYTHIYIFLINPLQSSKKIFLFAKNPGS